VLVENVAHEQRHPPHKVPAHARAGVEIDAQLVRMIEVVGAHRVRIQVDAPEVHHPQKLRRIPHDNLSRRPPRRKAQLHRLDPLGALLGGPLLEERLTCGAIDISFEHDWPPRYATQCALCDRRIVSHQVKLGVAGLRKEWLVGVRDHDLTATELQDDLARLPHRDLLPL
jgi:hypothetical protein